MAPRSALLPALVLLAGCGGDGEARNAYVQEVQQAQRSYAAAFESVTKGLTPQSTAREDARTLMTLDEETGRFLSALRRADVPEEVREEHAALTRSVATYRTRLQDARGRLAGADPGRRRVVRTDLVRAVRSARTAIVRALAGINRGLGS